MPSLALRNITYVINKHRIPHMSTLETLKFDNLALKKLPIDPIDNNYVRTVNGACFSKVLPTPVQNPRMVAYSASAMELLDIFESEIKRKEFVEYFSGNKLLPGSEPAAHCYCGHQFGYFSGQLGDGATMYLGEVINSGGERWEIQLKGAGLTPYSRTADGRKVLRSSIREFLCSEAMHFLNIPTTRAGTCITSDSEVDRDIFYNGRSVMENCCIILRIAPTFIRFGSFEIFKCMDEMSGRVGPSVGRTDILHVLLDYVIETFFPEINQKSTNQIEKYSSFFKEVVIRTARLVVLWQSVGFCHGVLNTDNMSILGLTLDYGPFGFLDMYDPDHVCNASDDGGRYSFSKQPEICLWNLRKLAEAIQRALPLDVSLPLLEIFDEEFNICYMNKMRSKIGLVKLKLDEDKNLIEDLFNTMENTGADFTNTFCCFLLSDASDLNKLETSFEIVLENIIKQCYPLEIIIKSCKPDMNPQQFARLKAILNINPEILDTIGRTGLAIKRMMKCFEKTSKFEEMTDESKLNNDYTLWRDWLEKYKKRIKKDLEAWTNDFKSYNKERIRIMSENNPRFILRNYIAQNAINKAENNDLSEVQNLLKLLETPYEQSALETICNISNMNLRYDDAGPSTSLDLDNSEHKENSQTFLNKSPAWAFSLKVT